LLFPVGTYKFTGSITPGSTTTGQKAIWAGEGWQSKLKAADATSLILITNSCTIKDIYLLGSVATPGAYAGTGIQIGSTDFVGQVELQNVRVRNFQTGVRMAAALWTTLRKCTVDYNRVGVDFNAGSGSMFSTTVLFGECNIADNERNGVTASYVPHPNYTIAFRDGSVQNNGSEAPATYPQFTCGDVRGLSVDGVYFENSNDALNMNLASANGAVVKNCFIQSGTVGIKATSAALKNALITGNYFSDLSGSYSVEVSSAENVHVFGNQLSSTPSATTNSIAGTRVSNGDAYPLALRYATEGEFAPTIQGTSTAGSNTYTTQTGYYNQVGNVIHFRGRITMSVKDGAMAGNVQIKLDGLPNSATASQAFALCQITPNAGVTFTATYTGLFGEISSAGTNLIDVQQEGPSGVANLPVSGIAAGLTLRYAGSYVITA
jgi:hypothetical protein